MHKYLLHFKEKDADILLVMHLQIHHLLQQENDSIKSVSLMQIILDNLKIQQKNTSPVKLTAWNMKH